LKNIVGFDLNPLAVLAARTNYLIALGKLIKYKRGEIEIPVYFADSILVESKPTVFGSYDLRKKARTGYGRGYSRILLLLCSRISLTL